MDLSIHGFALLFDCYEVARMRLSWLPLVATYVPLMILFHIAKAQNAVYLNHTCVGDTYTTNSPYQTNLKTLLNSLSQIQQTNSDYGFYNLSQGEGNDTVNAIALCRGDISQSSCLRCLQFSTTDVLQWCPSQIEVVVWYDECMLRYSNRQILRSEELEPHTYQWNVNDVYEANWFSKVVAGLLNRLQFEASLGDSRKKFAVGDTLMDGQYRIYGLVQCTPDLNEVQCGHCVNESFKVMAADVPRSQGRGGRVLLPSCNWRYEFEQFYELNSETPAAAGQQPIERRTQRRVPVVIVATTLGAVAVITCIGIFILLKRRKAKLRNKRNHHMLLLSDAHDIRSTESLEFDLEIIKAATDNFSSDNKLGQGGFGTVYKGTLNEGKLIAVKRLEARSGQGDVEFTNEVVLLAKLQHRNLVRLLGYCLEGSERLLIYEFVPNSSLDHFLFDPEKRTSLDWEARYKIITGIAKGLLYLHEDSRLRVIHRDLKAGNILLDEEMCPKIADFGMARLFVENQIQGNTRRIAGTYGYMAPEYAMHGKFSVKSDVYSFGVMLLEIICGQKNSRFSMGGVSDELITCAWETWSAETSNRFMDPVIVESDKSEILRCIQIGLLCVQTSVAARPTMASIVLMLNSETELDLPLPSKPVYMSRVEFEMAITSNSGSNNAPSINQVSISDMLPR